MNKKLLLWGVPAAILLFFITYFLVMDNGDWAPVEIKPVVNVVYGLGTIMSDSVYHLQVPVNTTIDRVDVSEGEYVTKGHPLISLKSLAAIKAPFAGTVTHINGNLNENITPGTEILSLVNLHHRYIQVSLDQQAAMRVIRGQEVRYSFESIPDKHFTGQVESIYPNANEFFVRINPKSPMPNSVLPGMTADVSIVINVNKSAVVVPMSAIKNHHLKIKRGSKVQTVLVKTGSLVGDDVAILSPLLNANDKVWVKS